MRSLSVLKSGIILLLIIGSVSTGYGQTPDETVSFFNSQFIPVQEIIVNGRTVTVIYQIAGSLGPQEFGEDILYVFGVISREHPDSDKIVVEAKVGDETLFVYASETKNIIDYVEGRIGDEEVKSRLNMQEGDTVDGTGGFGTIMAALAIFVIAALFLVKLRKKSASDVEPQKVSGGFGFGSASLIIGFVMAVLFFVLFTLVGMMDASMAGGIPDDAPVLETIGLLVILGVVACIVGAGLGIMGLLKKNQKKIWPVLGLVLNVLIIIVIAVLSILSA